MEAPNDHFLDVGSLGLASRLKRLSEYYMGEVKEIYRDRGIDFDPKCFPLFSLLLREEETSVTQAASRLGFSHPHVIQLARLLAAQKLIRSGPGHDKRVRILRITPMGVRLGKKLEPVWRDIRRAIESGYAAVGVDLLKVLARAEQFYAQEPLRSQVARLGGRQISGKIEIEDYRSEHKEDFARLNREWLQKYFCVEPMDEVLFKDPTAKIIKPGGAILCARMAGEIVGTCALIRHGEGFEIARMAVTEKHRGLGIGEKLLVAVLAQAEEKKAQRVFLVTNSRLRPAISLYQKYGFVTIHEGPHPDYKRGDMIMERLR